MLIEEARILLDKQTTEHKRKEIEKLMERGSNINDTSILFQKKYKCSKNNTINLYTNIYNKRIVDCIELSADFLLINDLIGRPGAGTFYAPTTTQILEQEDFRADVSNTGGVSTNVTRSVTHHRFSQVSVSAESDSGIMCQTVRMFLVDIFG